MKGALRRSIVVIGIATWAGFSAGRLLDGETPWLALIWIAPVVASVFVVHSAFKLHYWKGRLDEASNWWGSGVAPPAPPPSRWWKNG